MGSFKENLKHSCSCDLNLEPQGKRALDMDFDLIYVRIDMLETMIHTACLNAAVNEMPGVRRNAVIILRLNTVFTIQ